MDKPTTDELRSWSPVAFDWAALGMDDDNGGAKDVRLQKQIDWAWGYVENITGRDLEALDASTIADLDAPAVAEQSLVLRVMQMGFGASKAAIAMQGKPWLKSFTAGSYSETRFSPAELGGNNVGVLIKVNPLLELAMLLWLLMTDAKRDEWLRIFEGRIKPAGTFVPMHFGHHGASASGPGEPYDEQGLIN